MSAKHDNGKKNSDITSEPLEFILFLVMFNSVGECLLGNKFYPVQIRSKIGIYSRSPTHFYGETYLETYIYIETYTPPLNNNIVMPPGSQARPWVVKDVLQKDSFKSTQ